MALSRAPSKPSRAKAHEPRAEPARARDSCGSEARGAEGVDVLRLPRFQYLAPRELGEAAGLLAEHGARAMVVAGGTDLYPNMKRRQQEPEVLIGLRGIAA